MLNLASHARVWVFQANRFLSDAETAQINAEMNAFIPQWAAHGKELYGDFSLQYGLFLIIGVDEQRAPASGCSIDTLNRKIQDIGSRLNVDFFDRLTVAYEDSSTEIKLVSMAEFKELIVTEKIDSATTVYNNLIESVADLDEKWRTKVGESWHRNLLQLM